MFDAASEVREEGDTTDVNTKGLVSFDRKVKKDAYYFYQAAWRTDVPVLHLTGKRYTDRAYRSVDVRAYSNQPRARLSVNGRDIGWTNCIDAVCVWKSVRLDEGAQDRKSAVEGKSVSVRVVLGGRRTIIKKNPNTN